MNFKFFSKPKVSAVPKCNVDFLFSAEPFSTASCNEFWVKIPPLWKQTAVGIWGSKG